MAILYTIQIARIAAGKPRNDEDQPQHVWDFMFTTDPTYLSDGYRVQFRYPANEKDGEETVFDLTVEHANLGNG